MTYEEALAFLNAPKYSETRPGLGPVTELMHRLGDPQDQLKFVHPERSRIQNWIIYLSVHRKI